MTKKQHQNADPESKVEHDSETQRLQRFLAGAGLGSRRECEQLISDGRVEVDGTICNKLGTRVDPDKQTVTVDGEKVRGQKLQYFMLNKPSGVVSTTEDPAGRTRVIDLIKTDLRVYNVGRLDQSSEGLIIVTNDGDLAFRLTHPKFGVEKKYLVQVVGFPHADHLKQLEQGVYLAEGKAKAASVKIKKASRTGAILEMVLEEGRNREIRRVLARIGHKVTRLKRIAVGPLQLGELPEGEHRRLTSAEVNTLKKAASGPQKARPSSGPKGSQRKTTKYKSYSGPFKPSDAAGVGRDSKPRGTYKTGGVSKPDGQRKPDGERKPAFERKPASAYRPGRDSELGGTRRSSSSPKPGGRFKKPGAPPNTGRDNKPYSAAKPNPEFKSSVANQSGGQFLPSGAFMPGPASKSGGASKPDGDSKPRGEFKPGKERPGRSNKPDGSYKPSGEQKQGNRLRKPFGSGNKQFGDRPKSRPDGSRPDSSNRRPKGAGGGRSARGSSKPFGGKGFKKPGGRK